MTAALVQLFIIGALGGLIIGLVLGAYLGTLLARWHHAQAMKHLIHTSTLQARANSRGTYGYRNSTQAEMEDFDELLH
jgi:hypothetical protein